MFIYCYSVNLLLIIKVKCFISNIWNKRVMMISVIYYLLVTSSSVVGDAKEFFKNREALLFPDV